LIGRRTLTTVDAVAFSGFSSRPKATHQHD
jgi:hypothetical protein